MRIKNMKNNENNFKIRARKCDIAWKADKINLYAFQTGPGGDFAAKTLEMSQFDSHMSI